jgi:hypothetical protein
VFRYGIATIKSIRVPEGTVISVRLQNGVSSATSIAGQHFDAVLEEPLVNENTVGHRDSPVVGRVVAVRRSGRLHKPGFLRLALASIEMTEHRSRLRPQQFLFRERATRNATSRSLVEGAGAGALIGALAGGVKGALIGSAVGAGAGTTTAYVTGKKDVGFASERILIFRLVQPATAG